MTSLKLTFETDMDKNFSLTIPDVLGNPDDKVPALMDALINSGVILTSNGDLQSKVSAKLYTTAVTDMEI